MLFRFRFRLKFIRRSETMTLFWLSLFTLIMSMLLSSDKGVAALPNPASQNCIAQGGQLALYVDRVGNEYGVCWYNQERCCEEWEMFRRHDHQCPSKGLPLPKGISPSPRYRHYKCHSNDPALFLIQPATSSSTSGSSAQY